MGKWDYYPAFSRAGVLLCLACAEDDVRTGKRPPFDDDPDETFVRLAFFQVEGQSCSRCHKQLAQKS